MIRLTSILVVLTLWVSGSAAAESHDTDSATVKITPMVHSSVQVEYGDFVIQVDPWSAIDTSNYLPADLILVTDSPSHHKDNATITALSGEATSVIAPQNSADDLPQAIIMNIGEILRVKGITVEAIAAYDIIPGAPEHPRGDANGYVITIDGLRIFFAGVTECVAEVKALENIDIAFMPMNIPVGRMTPDAAAVCTKTISPEHVYIYHYDQDWVRRLGNPDYAGSTLPDNLTIPQSLDKFSEALQDTGINFVQGNWYPLDTD